MDMSKESGSAGISAADLAARVRGGQMSAVEVVSAHLERIEGLDGFEAYHALDCGRSEILSISLLRDQASAEASESRAFSSRLGQHSPSSQQCWETDFGSVASAGQSCSRSAPRRCARHSFDMARDA